MFLPQSRKGGSFVLWTYSGLPIFRLKFVTWIEDIFRIVGVILDPKIFARQRAFYAKQCPF
jgi:hypothetical protein